MVCGWMCLDSSPLLQESSLAQGLAVETSNFRSWLSAAVGLVLGRLGMSSLSKEFCRMKTLPSTPRLKFLIGLWLLELDELSPWRYVVVVTPGQQCCAGTSRLWWTWSWCSCSWCRRGVWSSLSRWPDSPEWWCWASWMRTLRPGFPPAWEVFLSGRWWRDTSWLERGGRQRCPCWPRWFGVLIWTGSSSQWGNLLITFRHCASGLWETKDGLIISGCCLKLSPANEQKFTLKTLWEEVISSSSWSTLKNRA